MANLRPTDIVWSDIGLTYSDAERNCAIQGGVWDEANQRCIYSLIKQYPPQSALEAPLNGLVYTTERGWTTAEIAARDGLTITAGPNTPAAAGSLPSGSTVESGTTATPASGALGTVPFVGSPLGQIRPTIGTSSGVGALSPIVFGPFGSGELPRVRLNGSGIGGGSGAMLEP